MRKIELEELKSLQVEILSQFSDFCLKNNLRYSLAYGTLIGAVRHKGYIPWDDDIDVYMPRPDYNIFLNTFNGFYSNLSVYAPELNPDYYAPYANVVDNRTLLLEGRNTHRVEIGVKIDVFPLDGVLNEEEFFKSRKKIDSYNRILWQKRCSISGEKNAKAIIKLLLYKVIHVFKKYSGIQKKIIAESSKNDYNTSPFVDNMVFPPKMSLLPKNVYESFIDVDFEGRRFKAIEQFDVNLRTIYGNYMELPPIEQRIGHHHFEAYWKD